MADLSRAKKAFQEFSGHRAKRVYKTPLDEGEVSGYRLGSLLGVAYEAKRDGKTDRYFHEFGKKARPDLVVRDDGKQLYVSGGRYEVTDHGIEDMPHLFVVNPSPRRKKKAPASKRKAPTMARRRRRKSSVRRVARAVTSFRANPIRRRRRRRVARASSVRRFKRNPIMGVRRRRRSSGGGRGLPKLTALVLPAIGIGAGAVLSEVAMGYLPIPANLKTGPLRHVTKGAISLALGMAVAKFANKKTGELMALGGLTIAAHDLMKESILRFAPSTKFGGVGYYNPGQTQQLGYYDASITPGGFGMYTDTRPGGFAGGTSGGETEFSV